MKKLLVLSVVALLAFAPLKSEAQVVYPPDYYAGVAGSGGPAFLPFVGFLGLAFAVEYMNAAGIEFPLCGLAGLKCYDDDGYPQPVHKDGV